MCVSQLYESESRRSGRLRPQLRATSRASPAGLPRTLVARLDVVVPSGFAGSGCVQESSEADLERLASTCWLSAPAAHSGIRRSTLADQGGFLSREWKTWQAERRSAARLRRLDPL